ncbi:MAG: ZIP family metal transporter [Oxalobacter sp.]|nr:ZIP family metal transporter [Oxalobacter sp.]
MDSPLVFSLIGIFCIGAISIPLAALLSFSFQSKMIELMISLSVGMMLSTSLLHALPEAMEMLGDADPLFVTLLAGLLGFFLLEKLAIMRHSHHYEHDGHHHEHGHDREEAGASGWMILVGHGFHSFTDGILIAAAFLTNTYLGLITCLAILAHEIPNQVGDFIVLLNAGFSKQRALAYSCCNVISSAVASVIGYYALERMHALIPYVLTLASAGFIYIALSDLMPQMQQRTKLRESIPQVILVSVGIGIIFSLTHLLHHHH